jgi:hypothetical protein
MPCLVNTASKGVWNQGFSFMQAKYVPCKPYSGSVLLIEVAVRAYCVHAVPKVAGGH